MARRIRLDILRPNHAGALVLKNGRSANYGVIRVDKHQLIYYTGKGLREIFSPSLTAEQQIKASQLKKLADEANGEEQLKKSGYIDVINLDDIDRVIF